MKRYIVCIILTLVLVIGCTKQKQKDEKPAGAKIDKSPFEESYSQFTGAFEKKDYLQAYNAMRSSFKTFWEKTPFMVNNVRFVKSGGNSFGLYEPREGDTFSKGEPIYLYVEPIGYTLKKNSDNHYDFGFTADFSIENEHGKVLGGQQNFADLPFKSWNYNMEMAITFNYTLTGAENGKYKVVTTIRDMYSDKKTVVEKWITIG